MGLLRNRYRQFAFATAIVLCSGCGGLKLSEHLTTRQTDWIMSGGDIGRTNTAKEGVDPPLTVVWQTDAGAGLAESPGVITDNHLFVGNLHGEIHAVRVQDGKDLGNKRFGSALVGTPVVDGDMLFLVLAHDDPSMIAYNLHTGTILWKAALGDIESSPLLMNNHLYVTTLTGTLNCIEKTTGSIEWSYALPAGSRTTLIHSSPASDGNLIVFGSDGGGLFAVSCSDGSLRWKAAARSAILATPSVAAGRVFVGSLDSSMYAFDLTTGRLLWSTPLGAKIYGSQGVNERFVYVGTVGGVLYCLDAETGAVIWKTSVGSILNSTPLLSGSVVYVGCMDKKLYAVNTETGEVVWQYTAEGRMKSMPAIADTTLMIFTEDRSIVGMRHTVAP